MSLHSRNIPKFSDIIIDVVVEHLNEIKITHLPYHNSYDEKGACWIRLNKLIDAYLRAVPSGRYDLWKVAWWS
jgi:hypothetical protein